MKKLVIINLFMMVILFSSGQSINQFNDNTYTDVYAICVLDKDVYAVGSVCQGTSETDAPTLWKNGVVQKIGNMGNFNKATSVFVSGNDVYVTISETDSIPDNQYKDDPDDIELGGVDGFELVEDIEISVSSYEEVEPHYFPKAILWKNGERQFLWKGTANGIYVVGEDVFVVGEMDENPVLWKNGNLQILASNGSAESIVVHGTDVYVVGYIGNVFNGEAVIWKNGEMTSFGRGLARSVFVADNGDVYVAGTFNMNNAALWKNEELLWTENTYTSNAYSMTMAKDGKIILSGDALSPSLGWIAVVWIDGICSRVDDKMRNQAQSVVVDGSLIYVGGSGKGDAWPVWKYEGETTGFSSSSLNRAGSSN